MMPVFRNLQQHSRGRRGVAVPIYQEDGKQRKKIKNNNNSPTLHPEQSYARSQTSANAGTADEFLMVHLSCLHQKHGFTLAPSSRCPPSPLMTQCINTFSHQQRADVLMDTVVPGRLPLTLGGSDEVSWHQTSRSLQQEQEVSVLRSRRNPSISFPGAHPAFQALISHSSAKIGNKPQQREISVNILFSLHNYLFCLLLFSSLVHLRAGGSEEEVALKSQPGCQSFSPPQYYSQLITEMEILGWDKLIFIDAEFRTLKLKAEDSAGRQHAITIKLKSKYPAEAPEFSADLPVPLTITWTAQSTLAHVHSQFLLNVEDLSEFWSVMDEIDEQTWVLEPEKPTKADSMRRIAVGNNVSIKVQIDPRHPKMLPECCLLGAEHDCLSQWEMTGSFAALLWHFLERTEIRVVTPLRNKLNANMHLCVECGICYSYRLESAIPDQVCNDPRCGQPFHQVCLYEWLRGLPTSRQSFNVVFGECPYCSKTLFGVDPGISSSSSSSTVATGFDLAARSPLNAQCSLPDLDPQRRGPNLIDDISFSP
ncbi:E3 ubiquitin-protein ligase FANCL [Triplophysa tibetana]|uniref:E3 ubiquitin-protein ligase FANCL n=1 Tax=Triplophysa tibetana TaxID=1572043 RepID=A0A5A9P7S3_9TELE|nr:E3 ubiquitin-protein ligase FANCL [Triplophysa tibetana]